jgi:NADPH-dependent glutamate synthase beta subunit-like oxidoreductase
MTLGHFRHVSALSPDEAVSTRGLREGKAVFVAGGTDLLGILKDRVHQDYPRDLVDLKTIPGLGYLREDGEGLKLGALATLADIARDERVRSRYGLLAEAARAVASPQLRNMGTIGGNICQEPRCWYYRHPDNRFPCLRKGGRHCSALFGENRFHSVFGAARVGRPSCSDECPGGIDIPRYMAAVRAGDMDGAARILLESNPLPAATGRVCPHYCEKGCNRDLLDESVSIRAVERRLGDHVLSKSDELYEMPSINTGKRVAVVGSGPAGLSAAFYLRRSGHEVRVFERMSEAGGMLRWSIPRYRLPLEVVRAIIASYERAGIVFELGAEIGGEGRSLESLRKDYDAVFLATGAWEQKKVRIEGAELLESGIDFLAGIEEEKKKTMAGTVLVIGGGNVAVDVAITAKRLGASRVTMACLESRDEMPAFPEEIEQALGEGVGLLTSWGPRRALTKDGAIAGMELVVCASVFDKEGRFAPVFDEARTMKVEADRVILAIGQGAELGYLEGALRADRGRIPVDAATQATGLAGLFAGGDAATGPASVIGGIAAGRRAAEAIDHAFGAAAPRGAKRFDEDSGAASDLRGESLRESRRTEARELPASRRCLDEEDIATLDENEASAEAGRCLDCSCVAVNASDLAPALVALGATIRSTTRSLEAEDFFGVRRKRTTRLSADELVTEIAIPPQPAGCRFAFHKFRIRASIDFPIVSLASALVVEGGRIGYARLVFGAVAPAPLRSLEVERFLVGRTADEETAREAGELAVRGARPLAHNAYKLQVMKALLRKAILNLR